VARYGQAFRDRVVARLLPPEGRAIDVVSREVGVSVGTLERGRAQALAAPGGLASRQRWTPAARLEAVITTAAMDETTRGAWCREPGLDPAELEAWKRDAIAGLGEPRAASAVEARQDRRRGKELERELHRKDKALAETSALLVLSKKRQAVFREGEDECPAGRTARPSWPRSRRPAPPVPGWLRLAAWPASTCAASSAGASGPAHGAR
jgi:transposase-like protein